MLTNSKGAIVKVVVVLFIVFFVTIKPVAINGSAMEPGYPDGERYLSNKFAYVFSSPKRGDVVVFNYTQNRKFEGISRVIGLPGETIKIQDGMVYINNKLLNEDYLVSGIKTETAARRAIEDVSVTIGKVVEAGGNRVLNDGQELVIPDNAYFMMGDNREKSFDSRSLGLVDKGDLISKVLFKY